MGSSRMAVSVRRELISKLMTERESTGETWRSIAARTGINYATLTGWAWRLRRERAGPDRAESTRPAFVELIATDERSQPGLFELVLRGERRVRVDAHFDDEALARLVRLLEAC